MFKSHKVVGHLLRTQVVLRTQVGLRFLCLVTEERIEGDMHEDVGLDSLFGGRL